MLLFTRPASWEGGGGREGWEGGEREGGERKGGEGEGGEEEGGEREGRGRGGRGEGEGKEEGRGGVSRIIVYKRVPHKL